MTDQVVWRRIYDRPTAFIGGVAAGDCYVSKGVPEGDVWKCRVWYPGRTEGGRQQYVLPPEGEEPEAFAMQQLVTMLDTVNQERGE